MSTTYKNLSSLDDQDESVRIAVRALGDMRNGQGSSSASIYTPALSEASTASTSSLITPIPTAPHEPQADYLSRVSGLPLVDSAWRASMAAYEQGKASSRVVKYGAEMMESSLSSISRPVMGRLNFAGRRSSQPEVSSLRATDYDEHTSTLLQDDSLGALSRRASSPALSDLPSHKHNTHTSAPQPPATTASTTDPSQRSRWQNVLLEAGGISAAVSEDNMRRLAYCLNWLQYATAHIDAQILSLRVFITSLQSSHHDSNAFVLPAHMRKLAAMKQEVVKTVREAVAIVSRYAGGALPEPARSTVRNVILCLPKRWAKAVNTAAPSHRQHGHAAHAHEPQGHSVTAPAPTRKGQSTPYSRPASPTSTRPSSPRDTRTPISPTSPISPLMGLNGAPPTAGSTAQAAERVLTLATESLDMMRGVTSVVKESLDRAETWVERFRAVGMQRGASSSEPIGPIPSVTPLTLRTHDLHTLPQDRPIKEEDMEG